MIATTEDHLFWNLTDRVRQEVQAFDDGDQLLTADGDTVLAFDADDGSWAPQAVLHQWSYLDTDEMATLRLTDGSTVTATDHHRFWSSSSRTFQEAEQLTLGDQLVTPQGEMLVDAVVVWPSAPTLVWELTVAGPVAPSGTLRMPLLVEGAEVLTLGGEERWIGSLFVMSVEPVRHLFTVEEYERMGEAGLFEEGPRVELVGGEIIEMSPIGRRHAACVNRLNAILTGTLGDRFVVAVQNPMRLDDLSEPQPDLMVLAPRADFYEAFHPRPEDTLLVIEVAETSLAWDRGIKRARYAAAGVAEVWVVDLGARVVEVATEPGPDGYAQVRRVGPPEAIVASAVPGLTCPVEAIIG